MTSVVTRENRVSDPPAAPAHNSNNYSNYESIKPSTNKQPDKKFTQVASVLELGYKYYFVSYLVRILYVIRC